MRRSIRALNEVGDLAAWHELGALLTLPKSMHRQPAGVIEKTSLGTETEQGQVGLIVVPIRGNNRRSVKACLSD